MAIDLVLETTKQKNDKTLASSPFVVVKVIKNSLEFYIFFMIQNKIQPFKTLRGGRERERVKTNLTKFLAGIFGYSKGFSGIWLFWRF